MKTRFGLYELTSQQEAIARRDYPDRTAVERKIKELYQKCCDSYDDYRDAKFELGRLLLVIQVLIQVRHDRDFVNYVETTLKIPKSTAYEYRSFYLRVQAQGGDYADDPNRRWAPFEDSGSRKIEVEDVQAAEAALAREITDKQRKEVNRKITEEVAKIRSEIEGEKKKGSTALKEFRPRLEFTRQADRKKFEELWSGLPDRAAAAQALLRALETEFARQQDALVKKPSPPATKSAEEAA